jgi:hypothetical protein
MRNEGGQGWGWFTVCVYAAKEVFLEAEVVEGRDDGDSF